MGGCLCTPGKCMICAAVMIVLVVISIPIGISVIGHHHGGVHSIPDAVSACYRTGHATPIAPIHGLYQTVQAANNLIPPLTPFRRRLLESDKSASELMGNRDI